MTSTGKIDCLVCGGVFTSKRQLRGHLDKNEECRKVGQCLKDDFQSQLREKETRVVDTEASKEARTTLEQDEISDVWCQPANDNDGDDSLLEELEADESRTEDMATPHQDSDDSNEEDPDIDSDVEERKPYRFNPDNVEGWGAGYLRSRVGREGEPGKQGFNKQLPGKMDGKSKSDIELLRILQGHPLSLFKEIREWRHKSEFVYGHEMDPTEYHKTTRDTVISDLAERYGLNNMNPKVITVRLPKLKKDVEVVLFPFGETFVSMLTAPGAMKPENMAIDQKNPFDPPKLGGEDGFLDDINTGSVHVDSHEKYCVGETDIAANLIAFLDKSFLDQKGKLTLEPLMYSTSLFNRKYRNNPAAWRPMGYIPNLDHLAPRANAKDKLHDYHFCMSIIMSEMIEYQKLGGIDWQMIIDGTWTDVRLQIPLSFVIGDTEGHDKMAGRKIDRSSMKSKQCRYCDVDHVDCDKPNIKTRLTTKAEIQKLRKENTVRSREELDKLSYRQIDDAFDEVAFADVMRGIHGATPAEVLHAVNLGIHERALCALFVMKRITQAERKRQLKKATAAENTSSRKRGRVQENDSSDNESRGEGLATEMEQDGMENVGEEIYRAPEAQMLSNTGIFTPKTCDWVDDQCKKLHKQIRWQSDDEMPRTNFPHGIASLSKMTGNERTGVLLQLLLIMCIDNMHNTARRSRSKTRAFKPAETGYLVYTMGDKAFSNIVKHISLLLLFEGFLKCGRVPVSCIGTVKEFVPKMMDAIFRVFPRIDGTGHATIKSHLAARHMVEDILRFGSAENYNSGPMESSHIKNIKQPGRNTQKRADSFAQQCSSHYCKNVVIDRAWVDHPNWRQETKTGDEIKISNAWFYITPNKVLRGEPSQYGGSDDLQRSCRLHKLGDWVASGSGIDKADLVARVRDKILPCLTYKKQVTVHTTMTLGDKKFQANPCYGKEKLARQHWVLVERRLPKHGGGYTTEKIPIHLQCIVQIYEEPEGDIQFDLGTSITKRGIYFLAHTIDRELRDSGPNEEWGEEWNFGTLAENNQHLIHTAAKKQVKYHIQSEIGRGWEEKERDALIVVPVEEITSTSGLVGVLDPNYGELEKKFYFFILKHALWGEKFMERAEAE